MRPTTLFSTLASVSLATAAALAPRAAPKSLKVISFSVFGSGCPYETADVRADPSNTALDISLSDYVVQSGPGVAASEWRKNCKITLNLEYDAGFSLSTLTTDLRGYAIIPSDTKGQCQNLVYFSGESSKASYGVTLPGGYEGAFSLRSSPDVEVWSPCGGSTAILNVNTMCSISSTEKRGLIAVDRISNKLSVRVALNWKNCKN
ncbi:secreted protein [Naviculisporaceae sp. PSN 640]